MNICIKQEISSLTCNYDLVLFHVLTVLIRTGDIDSFQEYSTSLCNMRNHISRYGANDRNLIGLAHGSFYVQ